MKKTFALIALFLLCGEIMAQNGEILYNNQKLVFGLNEGKIFDFDQDSELDMEITINNWSNQYTQKFQINFLFLNPVYGHYSTTVWRSQELAFGDTISQTSNPWFNVEREFYPNETFDYESLYAGIWKPVDNGFCYGWIRYSLKIDVAHPSSSELIIYEYAYCTIPNYPFRVGQTSLDWGVEEVESTAFATIHPNPTNGTFTITGKNLKSAEVLNTLGQSVVKVQGEGETLQIDIANLPAGIYFVNIMDEEGRKCVRKIVKE